MLWDVGTGAGSIAIEWCRAGGAGAMPGETGGDGAPGAAGTAPARAYALECDPVRAARARENAALMTAPGQVSVLVGAAADLVPGLPTPDAVFIGGGCSEAVIEACLAALRPGGRLVAHSVTIDTELLMVAAYRRHGGALTRLAVEQAEPLGGMLGWKPLRPVVQWSCEVHGATP